MAQKLIISISGVRGIVGQNLNAAIAAEYGCAFGTFLRRNFADEKEALTVCIGRDSRCSGPMLASAVADGLCSTGINVIDLGMVTTPTTGMMVKYLACYGGVMITASHNPIEYNGIKLLLDNGMAPPADKAAQIKQIYLDKQFEFSASKHSADVTQNTQSYRIHIDKVLQIVDKALITSKGFKVVLDSVNGAGAPITKKLLAELGCQTIAINDEPNGIFEHEPEPTVENLTALCEIVKAKNVDIGFAQDPDADRLAIVDEQGRYIGEEYTLALVTKYILSKNTGSVATNLATSRMIDDIAGQFDSEVIRTAVGEANVADAMIKNDCVIGGEGNGGVIDLRVGPVRDSLVAIALTLQLMAETGKKISQLVDEIPSYVMKKEKFKADDNLAKKVIDAAKQKFADAKIDTTDGVRFDFKDGWLLLRTSNTEPIMRIMAEALNETTVDKYIKEVEEIRGKLT